MKKNQLEILDFIVEKDYHEGGHNIIVTANNNEYVILHISKLSNIRYLFKFFDTDKLRNTRLGVYESSWEVDNIISGIARTKDKIIIQIKTFDGYKQIVFNDHVTRMMNRLIKSTPEILEFKMSNTVGVNRLISCNIDGKFIPVFHLQPVSKFSPLIQIYSIKYSDSSLLDYIYKGIFSYDTNLSEVNIIGIARIGGKIIMQVKVDSEYKTISTIDTTMNLGTHNDHLLSRI